MANAPFNIAGVTVAAGTSQTVTLPVSILPDHTPVGLHVQVHHGKRAGPTICVTAAVHGDEVIGVEIVRRLLRAPQLASLRGTLLAVPVVNSFGFLSRSRYLPDRRDLNRCFPGHPSGSLGSRLAHIFLNEVVLRCDFGIDLHSAAIHRSNLPQVRISPKDPVTHQMAIDFGAPVVLTSPLRDGSLRAVAAKQGTPILLYEAGEGLRFDEMAVRAGVAGILRVMRAKGMLPAKGIANAKVAPHICSASTWLRAPAGGLLRTFRAEGETVAKGDVLATVSDPFGSVETDLLAPSPGILIGRAILPVVNEGDAVFHLAQLSPKALEDTVDDLSTQLETDPLFDEDEII
ncbi:succinylglutamate desuccinylase/aspartoacylase family protein [Sulfitobacter sp. M57]|uniref:succinylglutamate desuccinylase/aspartoacylase family protein n=1 Tax=unclassified Sulfitobacter TaxID=196795 RepID=UPI0023E166BB|nr:MULTISPECIES: succinylglutamate desuccinylase/aspartoacylase family protein [unclassified Sulfitobacter]MDF3413957.1 succinylglutamate desuccinylase/aspartoacylase family protein [Sulfitobacter sp. KE5]MDF3420762.1 succinylglutamate desuccinylase/aspartoacylase family protein [Sulfitobacter sp. KE43]MDF3432503.1 succinylglutamate desuccinylase/aspartoacylase family protein [Sulfitobacter sp. KE42]MDF3458142.1 succinylglutamate desuccinylase/aspartoacylase family protein [Sulfitobacter sp. S7